MKEQNKGVNSFSAKYYLLLFMALLVPTIGMWTISGGKGLFLIQVFKFPLIALLYYALIGYVISARTNKVVSTIFANRFILYTGKISYGLYVYHPLLFVLFRKYFSTKFFLFDLFISFGISYLLATISFYFFEVKFLKIKKLFEYDSGTLSKDSVSFSSPNSATL